MEIKSIPFDERKKYDIYPVLFKRKQNIDYKFDSVTGIFSNAMHLNIEIV